jgi:hypothetical protein
MLFVSWAPSCSRSDTMAAELGGSSHMVYSPRWGSHFLTAPFKYLSQTIKTLVLLFRERPKTVFVMTPPSFACLPVLIYAKLTGAKMVIDAHTGAFLLPLWERLLFVHKFFSRRAAATLVTNRYLKEMVDSWGAPTLIVPDVPATLKKFGTKDLGPGCHMLFVSSFTPDEPLETFMAAAARLPDITFYVSGELSDCPPAIYAGRPSNAAFTGYLPRAEYGRYVNSCDAVICLTTLDHAMQRGAYEAIYSERPVITTDFAILRDAFPIGAVHVKNDVDDIVKGIEEMRRNKQKYERDAATLCASKKERWTSVLAQLRRFG